MRCISNTKEGTCVNCGTKALLDANNKHKRYVCESCWYQCNYHKQEGVFHTAEIT